tara:strand:- start:466 stop:909 length:444 start_codon:yes stop_codon:yes gene_type:complete
MTLALSTIRTNIYTDIYNHLQTGTYALTTNNIHPVWKDEQLQDEGFPQVIITNILVPEDKLTFGRLGMYEISISFTIEVHQNSAANARTDADELLDKLKGAGKGVLETAKLNNIKLESEEYNMINWAPNELDHIYTMVFSARYIGAS